MSILGRPFVCDGCFSNFKDEEKFYDHVQKCKMQSMCPICKKFKFLQAHHYSYKDMSTDRTANTVQICQVCHTAQQTFLKNTTTQKMIRNGVQFIYTGHLLHKFDPKAWSFDSETYCVTSNSA